MWKAVRALKLLLFASIPTLLLLVGLELGFRSLELNLEPEAMARLPPGNNAVCYQPSFRLGYEPMPGACDRNALGFFAPDYPLDKAAGTYRILAMGDSITESDLWTDALRKQLKAALPDRRIEVWNAGVTGYDTCSELGRLEEVGLRIDPDMLLVQTCINDFLVSSAIIPVNRTRARFVLGDDYVDFPVVALRSRLLTWLMVRYGAHKVLKTAREAAEQHTALCFRQMRDIATARGIPLVSILFPSLTSREALQQETGPESALRNEERMKYLQQFLKIDYVELRGPLEAQAKLETLRAGPDDFIHPHAQGHAMAATEVTRHLLSRYFAPSDPAPAALTPGVTSAGK